MIVSCPSCTTRFTVDPSVLGAHGRRVRCVRCGHVWFQEPQAVPEPERPAAARYEPVEAPPGPPEWALPETEPESGRRSVGGWLLFAAVVVLLGGGILLGQKQVIDAWPASTRLYETLGLTSPALGDGLDIRDVRPEARLEDGNRSVVVTGRVFNRSEMAVDVPAVKAMLLGEDGQTLSEVTTAIGLPRLDAGEDAGFAVEFSEPPDGTVRIGVTFEERSRN